jgi:hypothetical protein
MKSVQNFESLKKFTAAQEYVVPRSMLDTKSVHSVQKGERISYPIAPLYTSSVIIRETKLVSTKGRFLSREKLPQNLIFLMV